MQARRFLSVFFIVSILVAGLSAQKPAHGGPASIEPAEFQEWLSYVASDELQGRQIYTEGLGLAAAYIADHLKEWGVKPAGEDGTYFQTVKVRGGADHQQRLGHGGGERRKADVQGRGRHHVPAQHGRQADDHRRSD